MDRQTYTTSRAPIGAKNNITNDSIENQLIVVLIKCSGNKLTDFFCIHVQFDLYKKARLIVLSWIMMAQMKIDEVNDINAVTSR